MRSNSAGRVPVTARGFTLIELMVTLAILGVLTAIAIPSYSAYIVRGQRANAKAALLQTAQAMERYYTVNGSYSAGAGAPLPAVSGTASCVAVAPSDGTPPTYCVSLAATASTFLLSATPCGDGGAGCPANANNSFIDADCNVLTLDNTGIKGVTAANLAAAPCWQK
jgi:type IV pilus assembly protein PilE